MKPISGMSPAEAAGLRYILLDIDDTITRGGKLPAASYTALWKLKEAGLRVIPVTGRPAGWCDLIAREWPVDGVVGENGALVFWEEPDAEGPFGEDGSARRPNNRAALSGVHSDKAAGAGAYSPPQYPDNASARRLNNRAASSGVHSDKAAGAGAHLPPRYPDNASARRPRLRAEFHPGAVRNDHPVLRRIRERAFAEAPLLRDAKDQFARLFDLALDFAEEEPVLPLSVAERVRDIALEEGARAKVSSIHVNIWMGDYDKLSMAEYFLKSRFRWQPGAGDREVVFVGDSPNDEPMFARFPLACAVADIRRYEGLIQHYPAFIAENENAEGFAEIAETILKKGFS
jgi:hydroxymethylpyrimidine pyrophosphatase-like HAD family hydrolase